MIELFSKCVVSIGIIAATVLVLPGGASALSASGKLKVQGEVLPKHTVVIGSNGSIGRITSNSDKIAKPYFYDQTVSKLSEITPSSETYAEYQRIISTRPGVIGILYESPDNRSVISMLIPLGLTTAKIAL